jgi:hypothetical protein
MQTKPDYLIRAELAMLAAYERMDGPVPGDAKGRNVAQKIRDGEAFCKANPGNLKAQRQLDDLRVYRAKLDQACANAILAHDAAWERAGGVYWPYEAATEAYMARLRSGEQEVAA